MRRDYCAFDRCAREETLASAVGVDCRSRSDARVRITPYWAGGRARVDAKRDVAVTGKRANGRVGVEHKDKVGDLRADLWTPTGAARSHERWTRPATARASHYDTLPAFAAHSKTHFDHPQDRETPGLAEHATGDAFFRHPSKVSQNGGGLIYDFLFGRRARRRERKDARKQKNSNFFHDYNQFDSFNPHGRISPACKWSSGLL